MALIDLKPTFLNNVTLKIDADNYEKHVSSVEFAPTSSTVTWQGLTPDAVFTFAANTTWVCNLQFAQDWATEDSLSRYLFEHQGEQVDAEFHPENGGVGFKATLTVIPGTIGGAVNTVATATVALGVVGKPAFLPVA